MWREPLQTQVQPLQTAGIQKNAILYALGSGLAYRVVSVDSDTQLSLEPSVAASPAENYVIYNGATLGATLYVGGIGGNVSVEMAANKDLSASVIGAAKSNAI